MSRLQQNTSKDLYEKTQRVELPTRKVASVETIHQILYKDLRENQEHAQILIKYNQTGSGGRIKEDQIIN